MVFGSWFAWEGLGYQWLAFAGLAHMRLAWAIISSGNKVLTTAIYSNGFWPFFWHHSETLWRHKCKAKQVLGNINCFWEFVWLGMPWLTFAGLARLVQGSSQALPAPTQNPFGDINVTQNRYLET